MEQILTFLRRLSANNNREWFNSHKDEYLEVKNKVEVLTSMIMDAMTSFEPETKLLSPSDCLYRIYRDTRFSADKTPYKTHIGIYVNPPHGKKSSRCGYYLHLEPDDCLVGGGAYWPEPELLKALRRSIYDNVEEYLVILEELRHKEKYVRIGSDLLKTAPKGFPKDWEHIGLLKPRSFDALIPLKCGESLTLPQLAEKTVELFKIIKPYNDFFNYTIDEELHLY